MPATFLFGKNGLMNNFPDYKVIYNIFLPYIRSIFNRGSYKKRIKY